MALLVFLVLSFVATTTFALDTGCIDPQPDAILGLPRKRAFLLLPSRFSLSDSRRNDWLRHGLHLLGKAFLLSKPLQTTVPENDPDTGDECCPPTTTSSSTTTGTRKSP